MNKIIKCRFCKESHGIIKYYVINYNVESPKPYHPYCIRKIAVDNIEKLSDVFLVINGIRVVT
jgi:hypothetical protein